MAVSTAGVGRTERSEPSSPAACRATSRRTSACGLNAPAGRPVGCREPGAGQPLSSTATDSAMATRTASFHDSNVAWYEPKAGSPATNATSTAALAVRTRPVCAGRGLPSPGWGTARAQAAGSRPTAAQVATIWR
jgi:hypothetical protein